MAGDRSGAEVRARAAEAVHAVVASGRSLDVALRDIEHGLPPGDRPLLRMLAFGCLRHYWQLDAWVGALLERPLKPRDAIVRSLLLVGFFQLSDTRVPRHAAVSATVEAARVLGRPGHAGLVNAILRRFVREGLASQPPADESVRYNHPAWLIDAIRSDWPDDWRAVLEANNARAPMWLRVNRQRTTRDDYRQKLTAAGIDSELTPGLDDALRLVAPLPAADLPGFAEGLVSVQDGAAQVPAAWLLEHGAGRVLDACAAPGGKTAHLAEIGGDDVALTAVDVDPERLAQVRENLDRLRLAGATITAGDASNPGEWWDGRAFDRILVDAPCSASGVIRRHPDIKLLRRAGDIEALAARQRAILGALWPLLAPGGRLLYATCSVLAAENDGIVRDFLARDGDARANDMLHNNNIRAVMRPTVCGYQVLPGAAGLDGFYYACLEKVA